VHEKLPINESELINPKIASRLVSNIEEDDATKRFNRFSTGFGQFILIFLLNPNGPILLIDWLYC